MSAALARRSNIAISMPPIAMRATPAAPRCELASYTSWRRCALKETSVPTTRGLSARTISDKTGSQRSCTEMSRPSPVGPSAVSRKIARAPSRGEFAKAAPNWQVKGRASGCARSAVIFMGPLKMCRLRLEPSVAAGDRTILDIDDRPAFTSQLGGRSGQTVGRNACRERSSSSSTIRVLPWRFEAQNCAPWRVGGRELMWHGDPASWPASSPILFPICGATNGGVRLGGATFPLGVHGFAAQSMFAIEAIDSDHVRFSLKDDLATRSLYPFGFLAHRRISARVGLDRGSPGRP